MGTEHWTQSGESKESKVRTSDNAFDIDSPTAKLARPSAPFLIAADDFR